ncbi:hypothetical protein PRZ48_008864 [Zasmidium cellare]|uniref:Uncharacterized protein n=1 Tax=Zasmidium cellare TaxID=395010 RepID=A0ABR0EGR3_ZASCE|nr:hypothetical protein PRZ48_008864 [Zasmidium cellare]
MGCCKSRVRLRDSNGRVANVLFSNTPPAAVSAPNTNTTSEVEQRANNFISRRRKAGIRKAPASLSSTIPDNRANLARILHRLADFFEAFITYRIQFTDLLNSNGDKKTKHAYFMLRVANNCVRVLRLFALVALHEYWGGAGAKMTLPLFGAERCLLGGKVEKFQIMVDALLINLTASARMKRCVAHDAWFEMNVVGSMGLTRVYWKKKVLEDAKALAIASGRQAIKKQ